MKAIEFLSCKIKYLSMSVMVSPQHEIELDHPLNEVIYVY